MTIRRSTRTRTRSLSPPPHSHSPSPSSSSPSPPHPTPTSPSPSAPARHWAVHCGVGSSRPTLRGPPTSATSPWQWKVGMEPHWVEQTSFLRRKSLAIRLLSFLQLASGLVYLQYRARNTIGIFEQSQHPAVLTYQIFFFVLECLSLFAVIFRIFEAWNITFRNCIDFNLIPNQRIVPLPSSAMRSVPPPPRYSNYPSVAVFIPCYNEHVDLVTETVIAALQLDYPRQLLSVYLCDDGKDMAKRQIVSQLRHQYTNVNYVVRPQHTHAKSGNLNYAIRRTTSDLIVTLDADFVARPNLLNRLLPYFYVWNSTLSMYEYNTSLAFVQTPQFFRNMSPYDADPLDQRAIFFSDIVMPGKDWFNAVTMVGTTNLISRAALEHAGYYPYHSITEDTALALIFHGLGYRSYYVKESLATGLATESLWSNLRQRARWLKGDWQILFSKQGPLSIRGLSTAQRLLYLNMTFSKLISVVHLLYDISIVLLLTLHLSPLDARNPVEFVAYFATYVFMGLLLHYALSFGGGGIDKSETANIAFEAIFRYTTVKGLFIAFFRGDKLTFKVTDKNTTSSTTRQQRPTTATTNTSCSSYSVSVALLQSANQKGGGGGGGGVERFVDPRARGTVLGQPGPGLDAYGLEVVHGNANGNRRERERERTKISQGSTPLHSRRPSSTAAADAQDVSVGTYVSVPHPGGGGVATQQEHQRAYGDDDDEDYHNYHSEVVNMPPPVATLPPASRPPVYPGRQSMDNDPTLVSPPMTRTVTNEMGAMSAADVDSAGRGGGGGDFDQRRGHDHDHDHDPDAGATGGHGQVVIHTDPYPHPPSSRQHYQVSDYHNLPSGSISPPTTQPSGHLPSDHAHATAATGATMPGSRRSTLPSCSRSSSDNDNYSDTTDGRGNWVTKKPVMDAAAGIPASAPSDTRRRVTIRKNLKRTWFNTFMVLLLMYAIVWGILFPPSQRSRVYTDPDTGDTVRVVYDNILPTGLALGFALCNVLPHLLALYLCFIPYLSGWMMTDLKYGRCDQWAVHPRSGKLFVPFSFISLLSVARAVLISGAVAITIVTSVAAGSETVVATGGQGGAGGDVRRAVAAVVQGWRTR